MKTNPMLRFYTPSLLSTMLLAACLLGQPNAAQAEKEASPKAAKEEAQGDRSKKGKAADAPLILAAAKGDIEKIKKLLDGGEKIDAQNAYGITALMEAARDGHTEAVKLLLDRKADMEVMDENGGTALMHATITGHTEIVKLLLDRGANMEAWNAKVGTALVCAAHNGHANIVRLLLKRGADVNAKAGLNKGDALEEALRCYAKNSLRDSGPANLETIRLLLDNGADVNANNAKGEAHLYYAIKCGPKIVKWLLDKGADANALVSLGWRKPGAPKKEHLLIQVVEEMDQDKNLIEQEQARGNKNPDAIRGVQEPYDNILKIAQLLLENGADPDGKSRGTPPPKDAEYLKAVQKVKTALKERK